MLAIDMDKIFDPASITPTNHEDDIEAVQTASNETTSSSPGAVLSPLKKTGTRISKHMTIAEEVAKDTVLKSSITSTSTVSLSQSDFLSSLGTAKHQRQNCTRKNESVVDKEGSKDNTTKEDHNIAQTYGPIPCTTNPLPRLKTSKPKRVLTMNMSDTQGLSPTASSYRARAVPSPKRDCFQKPRQATCKSARDSSMWAASIGINQSTAYATPQTNNDDISLKQYNDILILEEVDSTEQISSNFYTARRSPKLSPKEQKHAKDTITGKKSNDKIQDSKDVASIG